MSWSDFFMVSGFLLAAYSIIANDAIQTLGTFMSSNSKRPWWVLWLFSGGILTAVFVYGWTTHGGDVSYGRLSSKFPVPETFTWIHALPPLILLFLTRFGIPVSTTFLVLTVFAPGALEKMLVKSLMGYAVAFTAGMIVYWAISNVFEKRMMASKHENPHQNWIALQWISTGFLWSQWLIQDLANIFVYMPTRSLSGELMFGTLTVMLLFQCYTFYTRGGNIQKIVTSKSNTQDIRSATLIDFIYGLILLVFKEWSNIPMSTTWVFLGLIAGRELAMTIRLQIRGVGETVSIIQSDGLKALFGLAISVFLAFALPWFDKTFF